MGNFSRDTFDKIKHYVSVRLKQGVPLVDADWNEREDIRKYELRAFLKWFVGNGVPRGNNGFKILPVSNVKNDFIIQGGDGTPEGAGRCLVQGWDVINESNIQYSNQLLLKTPSLANKWNVEPLLPLETPTEDKTYTVYVDVWEREVDAAEDQELIDPAVGIETTVRLKREWVVRVQEGEILPEPAQDHVHYPLARLNRFKNKDIIETQDITDLRMTGLSLISRYDIEQMKTDAFGPSYTLAHDGKPNLKVSLKEAVNALLRGELIETPEQQLTPATHTDNTPFPLIDKNGDIWMFWDKGLNISYRTYQKASNDWTEEHPVTDGNNFDNSPFAVVDTIGDIWVFFERGNSSDIWYKRYRNLTKKWDDEKILASHNVQDDNPFAIVDSIGDIWLFWKTAIDSTFYIFYRRFKKNSTEWEVESILEGSTNAYLHFVLMDNSGNLWVFWDANNEIFYNRYLKTSKNWEGSFKLYSSQFSNGDTFSLVDKNGDIWAFWTSNKGGQVKIWYMVYNHINNSWSGEKQVPFESSTYDSNPYAVADDNGNIWLFVWNNGIYRYNRYRFIAGEWEKSRKLFPYSTYVDGLSAIRDNEGDIWMFWGSLKGAGKNIWHKKFIPTI